MSERADRQRVDKWLWFARFAKTRSLAQKLVEAGRVRLNRERIDASSQLVKSGDVLTLTLERQVKVVRIAALGERRGPASEAVGLYEDLSPPAPPKNEAPVSGGPRPTKRDRRAIDAFAGTHGTLFPDEGED